MHRSIASCRLGSMNRAFIFIRTKILFFGEIPNISVTLSLKDSNLNQELLEHTIKNRRIELTNQEKKDYYPKETLLFAFAIALLMPLMAKLKGEIVETEFLWFFRIVSCRLCCSDLYHLSE